LLALSHPDISQICFYLGELSLKIGNSGEALEYFNKQLKFNHGNHNGYDTILEAQLL